MSNPLVTCLCLTRNRREWLPSAIECFLAQTYENRELLIVADGCEVEDLIPADERIRLWRSADDLLIGSKRNLGCTEARGSIVCHWDDDDWSAPDRIADQVRRMAVTGMAVTGYSAMKFTDGDGLWHYTGVPCFVLGTTLMYRIDFWRANQFANRQIQEDCFFVSEAAYRRQLSWCDAGDLIYASVHDGNTSKRALNADSGYRETEWRPGERESLGAWNGMHLAEV